MRIITSAEVARRYGTRIRRADPSAKLITIAIEDGAVRWNGDPARADICCFSEDFWQDLSMRRLAIPQLFSLRGLRWFHTFSAGTDSPAFKAIAAAGAALTNSSGASAPSIAQHVLAMMLFQAKRLGELRDQQARREWTQLRGQDLTGQTAGIIGTGAIGGEVARLARAFNMRTIGMRRSGRPSRWIDEMVTRRRFGYLLRESDFVVVACPLTAETEGLIGGEQLAQMQPHAVLINVARGRVIDEAALIEALEGRRIGGACLDVFTIEPLPESSPLWARPDVFVTPHNSGISPHNMDRAMTIFIDNLERFVAGKPLRHRVRF